MLLNLLTGLAVMVACLVLQAIFVTICLRHYVRIKSGWQDRPSQLQIMTLLAIVMVLMLMANFFQTAVWAVLFMRLREFAEFEAALYYSGVTFATLGYGDLLLSERWRLLGPLEAANGILMFGVSTAVMTAAVMDVIKQLQAKPRIDE